MWNSVRIYRTTAEVFSSRKLCCEFGDLLVGIGGCNSYILQSYNPLNQLRYLQSCIFQYHVQTYTYIYIYIVHTCIHIPTIRFYEMNSRSWRVLKDEKKIDP